MLKFHQKCARPIQYVWAQRAHSDSTTESSNDDKYLELKQLREIKRLVAVELSYFLSRFSVDSEEFYNKHAAHRRYFYYIDLQVSDENGFQIVVEFKHRVLGSTILGGYQAQEYRNVAQERQVLTLLFFKYPSK